MTAPKHITPAELFDELNKHAQALSADLRRAHLALFKEVGSAGRTASPTDATNFEDAQAYGSRLYARAVQSAVTLSHLAVQNQFALAGRLADSGLRFSPEAVHPALTAYKAQLEAGAKQVEAATVSLARNLTPGKAFAF